MELTIKQRIEALRAAMKRRGVQAFIIPSTDPHISEYVAPHWQTREWISGFTGSAGTVVITTDKAGLWTDSRYFLQAAAQLEGSGIDLYKEMLPETPDIPEFLATTLQAGDAVGIEGEVFSLEEARTLQRSLEASGIRLLAADGLTDEVWADRPPMPTLR